eukprot:TRINITY_DN3096_c0_g1_i2.p3 TRINITY_DN3096_c0_g1~~TRINITY_DN3096_c0_g1_i2.p3  ORF type:complete len:117 (+),score=22.72 TRINITY_DN3096_c0_g1_i2:37-387(+)
MLFFFFQAEDGIRDFCLSRGLGDVYKRQIQYSRLKQLDVNIWLHSSSSSSSSSSLLPESLGSQLSASIETQLFIAYLNFSSSILGLVYSGKSSQKKQVCPTGQASLGVSVYKYSNV